MFASKSKNNVGVQCVYKKGKLEVIYDHYNISRKHLITWHSFYRKIIS